MGYQAAGGITQPRDLNELDSQEEAMIAGLDALATSGAGEFMQKTSATTFANGTPAGGGDVTAAANITDDTLVRGDGGAKGVQDSGITIDDSDNMAAIASIDLNASGSLTIATANIISDVAGTATLSNIDALDATTEATIESAIDTLSNLTSASSLATVGTLTVGDADAIVSAASDSTAGKVELATVAETNTGTDTTRAVTPDSISGANRSIMLSSAGGAPATTDGCSAVTKVEAATNDIDYHVLDFDATTEEHAFWNLVMPDNYDGGTITAQFMWTTASGLATETVAWGIKGRAYANDDAIDQASGTEITTSDTFIAQGDVHISAESAAVTLGGTPAGGQYVQLIVSRKTASDDLTGDARLLGVKLEYTINAYSD